MDELRPNHHEIRIDARLADVWSLLTTAEGLASWFGAEAAIDLVVGGERMVGWGPEMRIESWIDAIEPMSRLRIVYVHDGEEVGAEEWLLTHEAGTTSVRLVHSLPDPGVEDWDGYYGDYRRGWTIFLTSMRYALEVAVSPGRVLSYGYAPVPDDRSPAWERIVAALAILEPEGLECVIFDPPNTVMYTGPNRSIVCDLEGSPPGLFAYVQIADHGGGASSRSREDAKRLLMEAVSTTPDGARA